MGAGELAEETEAGAGGAQAPGEEQVA
jgi:hypothetical protein